MEVGSNGSAKSPLPSVSLENLNALEAALYKALGRHEEPAAAIVLPIAPRPSGDDRIKAYVDRAMVGELASVRDAPKGTGNQALNNAALKLGELVGAQWISEAEVVEALLSAAVPRRPRKEALDTIRSGLTAGKLNPRTMPEDRHEPVPQAYVEAIEGMARKARAIVTPLAPAKDPLEAITLGRGVDWTRPAGLLGTMADWILATSRRPNRPLAVAAATAILSTVCGRHLYAPTKTSLNVYIICLAGTAVGKGRPLYAVQQILRAADLPHLHVGGDVFSVSAFEQLVIYNPCCVMTTDEIGDSLFKPILSKKAGQHEAKIKPALLKLFSREMAMGPYLTIGKAGQKSVEVHSPSISILGASTPQAFFDSLNAGNKHDGFMNRLLIATGAPRSADEEPEIDGSEVPETIKRALQGVAPRLGGNLGAAIGVYSQASAVTERKLPWASDDIERASNDLSKSIDAAMASDPERENLMGRIFEYSIRLASLHAVSRAISEESVNQETGEYEFSAAHAAVAMADLEWGVAWATESARVLIDKSESMMAPNEYGNDKNRVKELIKKLGTVSTRTILRKYDHLKSKELDGMIEDLEFSGVVSSNAEKTGGKGRPSKKVTWVG